ncbi:unnamed protein product [Ceutorhynchus assimilis]|uniref:Calponin-homology (CH) domain-containing protein n=1 Tax=Ceutorhynchus assimilis TaxID=467358 RepID=A0A9N9QD01_9CUCU|nr:unnamed protein product [Ceutorhynchus assimilis]
MNSDLDDVFRWIDDHEISRQKKNLHRDFADAVPLAEILKKHYPKLVQLHNYSSGSALAQKIINWETLNRKVLNKLKINLTYAEQEQLAKAVPGAVERLLHKIKQKVEKQTKEKAEENDEQVYFLEGVTNSESLEGVLDIKIKAGSRTSSQKMLPAEIYQKMELDLAQKDEEINSLVQQVTHLTNLLKLKEDRIIDLTNQLQSMANGDGDRASPRTRFFGKIF